MSKSGGLLYSSDEHTRDLERAIDLNGRFTDVTHITVPKAAVVAVSLGSDRIDYIGLLRRGRAVATGKKTFSIGNLTAVNLSLRSVKDKVPRRSADRIDFDGEGIRGVPAVAWESLLSVLHGSSSALDIALQDLNRRVAIICSQKVRLPSELETFEHDAIATSIETWGGPNERKRVLREAMPSSGFAASFLTRLTKASVREDAQINNDAMLFPGMQLAIRSKIGAVELDNGRDRLTIINCNRQPLEQTLGVDLIYYNHRFNSFVMVQYKRMRDASGETAYRPSNDSSHHDELARMVAAQQSLKQVKQPNTGVLGFRFLRCPFYFKVCGANVSRPLEESMVAGMYFPLELWRRYLRSKQTLGPKGGRVMNWERCSRNLRNAGFTSLLRNGWIGSTGVESDVISDLIEGTLSGKKMLIYAHASASGKPNDYIRDDGGRFARGSDPFGSR
jgi:hypothetical protein